MSVCSGLALCGAGVRILLDANSCLASPHPNPLSLVSGVPTPWHSVNHSKPPLQMTANALTIQQEAAQLAIALRDLCYLSPQPTSDQIAKAHELFESRHGYDPASSEELSELIRQRIGQIIALVLVDEPMQSFAPPSPNTKAGKLILEAKAKERRLEINE